MKLKTLNIKVIPNANNNKMGDKIDQIQKIYIAAPPIDNKANKKLLLFLSKQLNIKKSKISIIKGEKSQYKTIQIKE